MSRKIVGLLILIAIPVLIFAADQDRIVGIIGPATNTSGLATITLASPGAGNRNCLTDFSIVVTSNSTLSILDAGTTVYAIDLSTVSTTSPLKSLPFAEDWYGTNALCGGYNSAMYFTILNSTGSQGTYRLNYQGVIRGR